jgi:2-polyprenyl-3-methyl-5-hydroxy-6-metoxy-1,4-benzoquinol methylase
MTLLKNFRNKISTIIFRPSRRIRSGVTAPHPAKPASEVWREAIDMATEEVAISSDLPRDSEVFRNLAILRRQGPDQTRPAVGISPSSDMISEVTENVNEQTQSTFLSKEEVITSIRLMLNREPTGEREISRLQRMTSMISLRRALIKKLHLASPLIDDDALYKEFRVPLFLLAPPDGKLEWRLTPPNLIDPVSQLCTYGQVASKEYAEICGELKVTPRPHRKQWEFTWITASLKKAGLLKPGQRLIGFGCGREKLPAFFASCGAEVLATDAPPEVVGASWARGQQYSQDAEALYKPALLEREKFDELVSFRHVDMNDIPSDLRDFDACWSACALEHLGSIHHGLDFIRNSLDCLKPGGMAVHTTEFNLSSDEETFEHQRSSIFRKRDIVALLSQLNEEGHEALPLNLHPGEKLLDEFIDLPPYSPTHLKVVLRKRFVCTSIGIAVRKRA